MPATLIVANLRSGGGRARDVLPLVTNAFKRHDREYELIVAPTGEATAPMLSEFLASARTSFDQVAVIGGDGTLNGADRKSTRLNSSHVKNSYAVFCLKKKKKKTKKKKYIYQKILNIILNIIISLYYLHI